MRGRTTWTVIGVLAFGAAMAPGAVAAQRVDVRLGAVARTPDSAIVPVTCRAPGSACRVTIVVRDAGTPGRVLGTRRILVPADGRRLVGVGVAAPSEEPLRLRVLARGADGRGGVARAHAIAQSAGAGPVDLGVYRVGLSPSRAGVRVLTFAADGCGGRTVLTRLEQDRLAIGLTVDLDRSALPRDVMCAQVVTPVCASVPIAGRLGERAVWTIGTVPYAPPPVDATMRYGGARQAIAGACPPATAAAT